MVDFNVNHNTAGFQNVQGNQSRNLMDEAVSRAQSGNSLSETEVAELRQIANSDGNITAMEQMFLNSLSDESGRESFSLFTRESGFDANNFQWDVSDIDNQNEGQAQLRVQAGDRNMVLTFTENPSSAKQIHGDISQANQTLQSLIPDDRQADWANVDKHNVAQVRSFIDSLHLSTPDRANFVQAYMTANYNHPGLDIEWDGAGLQEGINAMPTDENGRKYMDCESYCLMAQNLLGGRDNQFTGLGVATTNSGTRDHQVGVFRSGNDAYVVSNNEVTRIEGGARRGNEALIQQVYPEFNNVVVDENLMGHDTSEYSQGQTLTSTDGNTTIVVDNIDNSSQMSGRVTSGNNNYNVTVNVNERDGSWSQVPNLKRNDTVAINDGSGNVIRMQSSTIGNVNAGGNNYHLRVTGNQDGTISTAPALRSGDVIGNGSITMQNATTGVFNSGGNNYHVSVDQNMNVTPAFQAGDTFTTNTGASIRMINGRDAVGTLPNGQTANLRVTVDPATGSFNITRR